PLTWNRFSTFVPSLIVTVPLGSNPVAATRTLTVLLRPTFAEPEIDSDGVVCPFTTVMVDGALTPDAVRASPVYSAVSRRSPTRRPESRTVVAPPLTVPR